MFVKGEDGRIFEVLGKNAVGQTILVTHNGVDDKQQVYLYDGQSTRCIFL